MKKLVVVLAAALMVAGGVVADNGWGADMGGQDGRSVLAGRCGELC